MQTNKSSQVRLAFAQERKTSPCDTFLGENKQFLNMKEVYHERKIILSLDNSYICIYILSTKKLKVKKLIKSRRKKKGKELEMIVFIKAIGGDFF